MVMKCYVYINDKKTTNLCVIFNKALDLFFF